MAHVSDLIGTDIEAYLEAHEHKSLLRFITCGSVDDGKSTLIGRLLYDSKMIFEDQLAALEADSKKVGTQGGDARLRAAGRRPRGRARAGHHDRRRLPVLLDRQAQVHRRRHAGPRAVHAQHGHRRLDRRPRRDPDRRAQGRADADAPAQLPRLAARHPARRAGHQQDGPRRLLARDLRHHRRRVPRLRRADRLPEVIAIPMSGLRGDNIMDRSAHMPWYHGPTLMGHLETVEIEDHVTRAPFRLPVQWVNRPNLDFRGFRRHDRRAARSSPGDKVRVLPSGRESRVARVVTMGGDLAARRRRPVDHAHARRRDRRQPRRRLRGRRRAARSRRPVRDHHHLDERRADAARAARTGSRSARKPGDRDDHRAQVQDQRQHARAPGREDAGA